MDYLLLGKNIAEARRKKHLTQEQLAEMIEVSTVFISQIETAVRKPSLETIYKISKSLNTTIDSLIGSESTNVYHDEISNLLSGMNNKELNFVTNILQEICNQINNNKSVL